MVNEALENLNKIKPRIFNPRKFMVKSLSVFFPALDNGIAIKKAILIADGVIARWKGEFSND